MGRKQNCCVLIDITGEITLTNRKRAKIVKAIPKRVEVLSKTGLQSSSLGNFANLTDSEFLRFRVKNVSLPSKSIATSETKIYGPVRLAPYNITYDQLSFSVYLSDNFQERTYFENWMHYVFDYDTNRLRYYSTYSASEMRLMIMNEKNKTTETYKFEEAYPLSVGEVSLAYENEEVATCDISMTYRKYIPNGSHIVSGGGRESRKKYEDSLRKATDLAKKYTSPDGTGVG